MIEVWYIHTDRRDPDSVDWMESRGYTREKAQGIIASQATEEYFRAHTDYAIENNDDLDRNLWTQIREGSRETCGFVALPAAAAETVFMWALRRDTCSGRCRNQRETD